MAREEHWKLDAACRTDDGQLHDMFFPQVGEERYSREDRERTAAGICATCPVLDDCGWYAVRFRMDYGMWAGEDGEELNRRVRQAKIDAGAPVG